MAFSYSDKNFTVIGNLCFVHIFVSDKNEQYEIPPAIADRMLVKNISCMFYAYGETIETGNFGLAIISNAKIRFVTIYDDFNNGYVNFSFPIDSNK